MGWMKRKLASAEHLGLPMDHYAVGGQDKLLKDINTLLRQLPYQFGFSPEAWQIIMDVEILKKAGIYEVELMRTIQLMHTKFNMNNKKLGQDMMSFAELCRAQSGEQFGSRKHHQAILAALHKRPMTCSDNCEWLAPSVPTMQNRVMITSLTTLPSWQCIGSE
jgi:hypothetical protein